MQTVRHISAYEWSISVDEDPAPAASCHNQHIGESHHNLTISHQSPSVKSWLTQSGLDFLYHQSTNPKDSQREHLIL